MTEVQARLPAPAPAPAPPPEVQVVKQGEDGLAAQDKSLHGQAQDRDSTALNGAAIGGSTQDSNGAQVQPAREKDAGQQLRQALFQQQQLFRGVSFPQSNNSPLLPISSTPVSSAAGPPRSSLASQNIASPSGGPLRCGSCGTADTPLWRRESTGKVVCNACGLASVRKQAPSDRGVQSGVHVAQPGPSGEAQSNGVQMRALSPYITQAPQENGQKAQTTTHPLIKARMSPLPPQGLGQADTASQPSTAPVVRRNANEPPVGSCPGDGHCNGQGGQDCCRGCPAFNNRYRRDLKQPSGSTLAHQNGLPSESRSTTSAGSQMQKLQAGDVRSGMQGPSNLHNHAASSDTAHASVMPLNRPMSDPSVTANMSMSARSDIGAMACENCGTRTTPLWRRDGEGRVACNACGLYYKLHGAHRPVNLNKPTIKRRKRAPIANGNGADDQSANGNAAVTSMSADQAGSSGQPARKKVRRSKDGTGGVASEASSPRSQSRTASPPAGQRNTSASATLPGNGVGDLTNDELAAVTALAMHANHEQSLLHSTTMDSELLETHGHPLHSASHAAGAASLDSLRDGSAPHKPAMQRALTGHEQLLAFRAELSRECAEAKSTIGRLEGFLAKSERIMSGIDARLKALQASSQAQVATQLPTPVASAEPATDLSNSTLAQLLQNIKPAGAITSTVLKNRKTVRHDGSLSKATSILWEICPSTTQSLRVVAA